jgi:hypothetical protein
MSGAIPFNTPIETGVRLVILLVQAFPAAVSLDRLVMLDHVLVHTADFGGPPSAHPPSPYRTAEPFVRRELVQRSLTLFQSRKIVDLDVSVSGFLWRAGEPASAFIECLSTSYHQTLRERAAWTIESYGEATELALASLMGKRVLNAIGIEVST